MAKPRHPQIIQYPNSDKWHCPRCQRVAPKKDLENRKLSHGICFKPHGRLKRQGKLPIDQWQCQDCRIVDKLKILETQRECNYTPKICSYCGERPECARDCLGVFLALSGELTPDIDIEFLGPEPPSSNPRRRKENTKPVLLMRIAWTESDNVDNIVADMNRTLEIRHAAEEIMKHAKCFTGAPRVEETETTLNLYYPLRVPKGIQRTLEEIIVLTARGLTRFFQEHQESGVSFELTYDT